MKEFIFTMKIKASNLRDAINTMDIALASGQIKRDHFSVKEMRE